jgi:pimeloyl-ACP methyl ester carboxylesterase
MIVDRSLIIDGIKVHLIEAGSGTRLMLVHGLGGSLMWQRVIEPLSEQFHLISIDLPGFGESDCPPIVYSTEQYCNFLLHVLDALGMRKVIMVGTSYGGQIAANFASRFVDRVEKLVLISSTGLSARNLLFHNEFLWIFYRTIAKHFVLRSLWLSCFVGRWSFHNIQYRPDNICIKFHQQVSRNEKRDAWLNGLRNIFTQEENFPTILSELIVPVLIIWGNNDRLVPVKYASEFQQCIPNSILKIFLECGHSVPLEKPDELCKAIGEFS